MAIGYHQTDCPKGLVFDLVNYKSKKCFYDTKIPYWDQVSLTLKLPGPAAGMGGFLTVIVA